MIMAAGLIVSKIAGGQRSAGSDHDEIELVKMQFRTIYIYYWT